MRWTTTSALVVSAAFHGAVVGLGASLPAGETGLPSAVLSLARVEIGQSVAGGSGFEPVDVELSDPLASAERQHAPANEVGQSARKAAPANELVEPGGSSCARPDIAERDSRGAGSAHRAVNLADSLAPITLASDPPTLSADSEIHRARTSELRRSIESRRTIPDPMELTLFASGPASDATHASVRGRATLAPFRSGSEPPRSPSAPRTPEHERRVPPATTAAVPAMASLRSNVQRPTMPTASALLARPAVRSGPASVSAADRGPPSDTTESALHVAEAVQALMTASAPGGERGQRLGGAGREHSGTGVAAGARSGSASAPIGRGTGAADAPQTNLSSYTAALTRKLEPYWKNAFPTWARLEGRSAVAVIGVTLRADGKVMEARVVRPSGIPEFDAKVLAAVFEAGPYAPLPARMRDRGLTLHIAFDALNPAVGHTVR